MKKAALSQKCKSTATTIQDNSTTDAVILYNRSITAKSVIRFSSRYIERCNSTTPQLGAFFVPAVYAMARCIGTSSDVPVSFRAGLLTRCNVASTLLAGSEAVYLYRKEYRTMQNAATTTPEKRVTLNFSITVSDVGLVDHRTIETALLNLLTHELQRQQVPIVSRNANSNQSIGYSLAGGAV